MITAAEPSEVLIMAKSRSLFEKEMEKKHFKENFKREYQELKLENQILLEMEAQGLTYEKFAKKIGSSKGNISRDLKGRGLQKATIDRIVRMAQALGLEFIPLLLPKDRRGRRKKIEELLEATT